MERLLFLVPPHMPYEDFRHPAHNARQVTKADGSIVGSVLTDMPLGVLSISAFLKRHVDVDVSLVDFNVDLNLVGTFAWRSFREYFVDRLRRRPDPEPPTIVGISALFTPSYRSMIELASVCRELWPDALVLAGGSVPSNMSRQILAESDDFDALCYGEGELPMLQLLQASRVRAFLKGDRCWITRDSIERGDAPLHQLIEDLDDIPMYDYPLCDMASYGLNPALTAYAGVEDKTHNFHVMTSRGCTFKCIFCASHKVHGRTMRYYSMDRVREDFTRLRDEYGAKTLVFQDDHLMADPDRVFEIIALLRELGLKSVFQNGLALFALRRPMLEALKGAGVDQLMLSIESGSDRVLREIMHKPLKLSIARRVADDCRELEIYTNANVLIGLPGETKADIEDARAFLKTLDANWFLVFCANPLVGSEMFEICEERGYLTNDYVGSDYKKAVVETEDFSAAYIQETAYVMNLELNFVHNADMRLGRYDLALKGIENAIRARPDHAIAHWCASKCHEALGAPDKAATHLELARRFAADPFWVKYIEGFRIGI